MNGSGEWGCLRPCMPARKPTVAAWVLACPLLACAQAAPPQTIVITATRTEAAPFDVPASIDVVAGDALREGRMQVNISESLGGVPGLLARDRQNYAQDVQVSVRGFGARSTFGIRGVRLYVDGIPATLPDGQGQISNVDLGSAERIEVLRGPFSALYGNSSGGVIQVFTEDGSGPPRATASAAGGSNGAARLAFKMSGSGGDGTGGLRYVVSASDFVTQGWREHSAAERQLGNAKLSWQLGDAGRLTLVANSVALPKAQDPLGLTRAQFDADPRAADATATQFNTRKTVNQTQLGAIYEQRFGSLGSLRLLAYGGHRNTEQFQSIPVATQAGPLHPGGVILLGRDYSGSDLRWSAPTAFGIASLSVIAGLAVDRLNEHRVGFQNFIGSVLGVEGALRRDENNVVSNVDPYLQAAWKLDPRWTLNAGVRRSRVRFASNDHYIVGTNPDDSGRVSYGASLPVLGLMFAATPQLHLYATAGRGFETPTLNELAYRPNGLTGLNLALQASRSDSVEAGAKARLADWGDVNLALFETRTRSEIVTLSNVGGRSTYQNAGATLRRGLELAWVKTLRDGLRAQLAYTGLAATYRDAFLTCTVTPCAAPNLTIPAGNRIPGLARSSLQAQLAWAQPQGWRAALEARMLSRVFVNDANNDAAAGFASAGASVGYAVLAAGWDWAGFARIDNLFARRYAGSVIVNEGNSRYFEPAPGRTWTAGVSGSISF